MKRSNNLKRTGLAPLVLSLLVLTAASRPAAAQVWELLVSSSPNNSVLRFDGTTGVPIDPFVPAGSGGLTWPYGLAFGPDGNLYVSSYLTDSILRYNGTTGAFIDVFVPDGSGGLDGPVGLMFGLDNNLYVVGFFNNSVLRYDGTTGAPLPADVPERPSLLLATAWTVPTTCRLAPATTST